MPRLKMFYTPGYRRGSLPVTKGGDTTARSCCSGISATKPNDRESEGLEEAEGPSE